ncbi:hypothetical protein LXA43DRAFT_144484 [Ganoderma leucocontextum]|nr:hypothetical protein LXA43DRAFT_144484 [Ganoderma leucocontextum]
MLQLQPTALHPLLATTTMDDSHLPSLPVELLINVASNLTTVADLCSLALVNFPCNYASTSILYADITLNNPYATRKCLDTLNRPSTLCSFQRDLPSFILSFVVDWGVWYADEDQGSDNILVDDMIIRDKSDLHAELYMPTPWGVPRNGLRAALESALLRMHNLHRFSCWESFMFTPRTFARLVAGPASPSLQELGATMEDWRLPPYRFGLDESRPTCPQLRKVQFILPSKQLDWDNCKHYVAHLLKTSAARLESVVLDPSSFCTNLDAPELFSEIRSWPALKILRLPTATDLSLVPHAPGLQCLHLDCDYSRITQDGITGRRSLPSSLYPRLERLYCSHVDLPAFLPADTDTCAPIHAVFLDEAVYGLDGGTGHSRLPLQLSSYNSTALEETLRCLPNSAVPVTELSLYLLDIDIAELHRILPYVRHLEHFVIVTATAPQNLKKAHLLGETMFAHMPRLHTFLLCAIPRVRRRSTHMYDKKRGGYLYERQERCLRAFDRHAPWLRRVMFTVGLEWVKKANGTWDVVEGQEF